MAIFHFNNIYLSFVIFFTLISVRHEHTHTCYQCPSIFYCCYFYLSFVSIQLLPTLDIYTWTEEHVVSISVFTAPSDSYFNNIAIKN